MNLDTFFDNFELFADAPRAVDKMRELVLALAVQGKLVEQDPNDEPAEQLLSRIEAHFQDLRRKRFIRSVPVDALEDSALSNLPEGWIWAPLGNVVDYASAEKSESSAIPPDVWLLDLEDIEKGTSRILTRKVFGDNPSMSTKTLFKAGDVLYGKLRPYLNKVLVADAPGFCTTEIIPIRTHGLLDPYYVCYALKRPAFINYANTKSYGMNLPRLSTEDARRAPFPLPPLAEQKRIVAKVDALMALCDRLEAQQRERDARHAELARASVSRFNEDPTPDNLKLLFHPACPIDPADLRKTILTLAVRGKLVPQDPADGFEEIAGKYSLEDSQSATSKSNFDPPWVLPSAWKWFPLSAACSVITDGEHLTPKYANEGVPILSAKHIGSKLIIWDDFKWVNDDVAKKCWSRCNPDIGDVLVVSRGGGVGRTIISDRAGYCLMGSVLLFKTKSFLLSTYLNAYFDSDYGNERLRTTSSSSAQQAIYILHLKRDYFLPLPPLAEQRRIVARVEELMGLVDQLEGQIAASRRTAVVLLEAGVSALTNGEL